MNRIQTLHQQIAKLSGGHRHALLRPTAVTSALIDEACAYLHWREEHAEAIAAAQELLNDNARRLRRFQADAVGVALRIQTETTGASDGYLMNGIPAGVMAALELLHAGRGDELAPKPLTPLADRLGLRGRDGAA